MNYLIKVVFIHVKVPVLNIPQWGLQWDVKLSIRRCQTLPSICLWAQQQIFLFLGCTLCNWSLSDAQTSRDLRAVIRRCVQTPQGRSFLCPLLPQMLLKKVSAGEKTPANVTINSDKTMKPPWHFYALVFICRSGQRGRSVGWCSHTGGTQRPLEADKKPAGVWCDDTLQSLARDSHPCAQLITIPPSPLFTSSPGQRRHDSNMLLMGALSQFSLSGINPLCLQPRTLCAVWISLISHDAGHIE